MDSIFQCYNSFPAKITDFKKQHMILIQFNQRMIALGFSTILASILIRKTSPNLIISTRKTLISYFLLGSFVVPEIFNPFALKQ